MTGTNSLRIAAALAAVLALAACGGGEDKETYSAPDGSKVEVTKAADGEVETATVTTSSGAGGGTSTFTTGGGSWPQGAPDYAAAYPGATVQSSFSGVADGQAGAMASFTTADPPEKVIDFYKARAKAAGLKNETSMEANGSRMYGASDDAGRAVSVQTSVQDGSTTGVVTYGAKGS